MVSIACSAPPLFKYDNGMASVLTLCGSLTLFRCGNLYRLCRLVYESVKQAGATYGAGRSVEHGREAFWLVAPRPQLLGTRVAPVRHSLQPLWLVDVE